jgi:mono/diheme cytochrome c family protein
MSFHSHLSIAALLGFPLFAVATQASAGPTAELPDATQIEFFETRVRPVLSEHCYSCHSKNAEQDGKLKGSLRVDYLAGLLKGGDSGASIVPGNAAESLLVEAVGYGDDDTAMPPKGKLADEAISILTEWVNMGAPWPGVDVATLMAETAGETKEPYDWEKFRSEHWSFRPVVKPDIPAVQNPDWIKNGIDAFVLARLEAVDLVPNAPATRRMLIRRAYLDLIGLPPDPEAVDAFLADEADDAFAKVIDGLLDSRHYGERWARHWLDVARYSDGHGGFGDGAELPNAWRYRDWVVNALNSDMPYDTFVRRQIAGDVLDKGECDPVGTGFFVVGPTYQSDGGDPEATAQALAETLSDRVDTVSRAFLGLTAACARCHDHKFDPITAKDYYALAGIFQNSRQGEHPVVPDAEVAAYQAGQKAIKDQQETISKFIAEEAKKLGLKPKEAEKQMEGEVKAHLEQLRADLEMTRKAAPPKYEVAHVLADSGASDMHVALRGDLRKKGELVPRRFLQIFAEGEPQAYQTGGGSGRRELAQSIADPKNPLTARVIVNRVWQWHFGQALVRTPSNFGILGEKPTHPELLDWLASDFVEHGWSLKHLHRQIMLSSTWQMSSHFDEAKFDRDGDNRLLWRMNPRKLDVETWRDTLLAVTGELDRTIGGAPVSEILKSPRRTLYAVVSRTGDKFESDAFLRLFDFPAASASSARRAVSTVPQQYLFMMNSEFMQERARSMGQRWSHAEGGLETRLQSVYQTLFSRPPEPAEIEIARDWFGEDFTSEESWIRYSHVLLSAHELLQIL